MRKVRTVVSVNEDHTTKYEFFGGVERQQDIDVFAFYQIIAKQIPNLGIAIRKILSHPAATIDNERVFNIAGHILNIRRCSLLPDRAEQLVLSAFRYRSKSRSQVPVRLPSFAKIDHSLDLVATDDDDDNLDEVRDRELEEAAAWEAFFNED